jgi:phenylalanyl-tRNA synthetase alpha chain
MPSKNCGWTTSQMQRLRELNATESVLIRKFSDLEERNRNFFKFEQDLVRQSQRNLKLMRTKRRRPRLCELEDSLIQMLVKQDFVQVMLAPNLYFLLRELVNIWEKPVRIFEVGPCFRKDTKGRHHINEFTMLNLVELGLPLTNRKERLEELATNVMGTSGIKEFSFTSHRSEVYGETIDVLSNFEVASGAMGPHPLDSNWGISDPWVGIGFGLERLLMVRENFQNIQRAGRALVYLDGERLNI